MVFILLSWLYNGFMLGLIYMLCFAVLDKISLHNLYECMVLGYATTIFLTMIGVSKLGSYWLRLKLGARQAVNRELKRIAPLLTEIIEKTNNTQKTNYKVDGFSIRVMDINEFNVLPIGSNTILLTEDLLKITPDNELKAILAYELAHLYYKDSKILMALIFSNFATKIILCFYSIYIKILNVFTLLNDKSKHEALRFIILLALIPLVIFSPIVILNLIVSKLLDILLLYMNRKYVLRADKFVKNLGYQNHLIGFLEKIQVLTQHGHTIMDRISATHPKAILRIDRLEC